jgi:hypothetical protein
MKKLLILTMILLCSSIAQAGEVTVTVLGNESIDWTQASILGRVGYLHQDTLEVYGGAVWWPNFKVDEDEEEPDYAFCTGVLYHWMDVLDPNNPIPFIPETLLKIIPEQMVARPYIGGQVLFKNDGAIGGVVGLTCKAKPGDNVSLKIEGQGHNTFRDLAAIPEDLKLYIGFEVRY